MKFMLKVLKGIFNDRRMLTERLAILINSALTHIEANDFAYGFRYAGDITLLKG